MPWVTILWSMVASACLTLAAIHLLIWSMNRAAWANLLFSLSALATAALAGCEYWMMRAETPAEYATALRWLHVPQSEYRVPLPDGTHRWIVARSRMYPDTASGMPARMLGVTIDTTARKTTEQALEMQRDELVHLARITTLNEFSNSLAHELNQPLAIILTNAQAAQRLLAQSPPDLAEARDILTDIVSEDQRAGEVIRRLRSLLKHGQSHLLPLSVNTIVEDVLRIAHSELIGRGITVHTALAESVPKVAGDRIQLQQVLLNLILNACEAMAANPPASRHLTLANAHFDGTIRISVSDTGCGLPSDAESIFKPFYTTKRDGLGLGLPICRSIVTAHHGRLWAEAHGATGNSLGATAARPGATLHLDLPAVTENGRLAHAC